MPLRPAPSTSSSPASSSAPSAGATRSRSRCSTSIASRSTTTRTATPRATRLLTEVAAAWQGCLRATDSVARYGGEEFALVAPGCTEQEAVLLVDRLRDSITEGQTCSAGVALWDGAETPAELLARADAALYEAKVGGRNRTRLATRPGTAPAPTEG
jgi:hypothetical protein